MVTNKAKQAPVVKFCRGLISDMQMLRVSQQRMIDSLQADVAKSLAGERDMEDGLAMEKYQAIYQLAYGPDDESETPKVRRKRRKAARK